MTDGGNLGHHLRDDHRVDRSPLVEATFVPHFVQMPRGSAGAGQTEARIAGKAQKMTAVLLKDAPGEEVRKAGQKVGQGEDMRVRQGTWGRKALALARVLPEN
jgi:hypothetical protein